MEKIIVKEQNLYYMNDDRSYRIRGFEDIILSHLRVNIKVSYEDNFFIDIVDLYSQNKVVGFVKTSFRPLLRCRGSSRPFFLFASFSFFVDTVNMWISHSFLSGNSTIFALYGIFPTSTIS